MPVEFKDIERAYGVIKDSIIRTPTVKAARLSLHMGIEIFLKLENLQYTNAFKARGALNKLLTLSEKQRKAGVIAFSAGNHAQGVAYHAQRLGIPAIIVMPNRTPFNKIAKTEDFGAKVLLFGDTLDESMAETQRIAKNDNLTFIHPFDDPDIIAGQGTLGLEMMEQRPDLDVIVVPIGGGGLMTGVATAVKGINPKVNMVGVQVESHAAVKARIDGYNALTLGATLAEGIAVKEPAAKNVEAIRKLVSRIEVVNDNEIEKAIFDLLSDEKLVVEGAAAAALAAVQKDIGHYKGKKVGLVLTGGNIDSRLLSTLIMRGMIREGRITRLRFEIDDTPGQLSDISRIIGESGANVIEVIHQRMMQTISLKRAELDIVIEARDKFHVKELVNTLSSGGFNVTAISEV